MNNLLVVTQKVSQNDSNLGFFHEWLWRLAGKVEKLTIICLEKGEYQLPKNVTVLSLGKENQASRWEYFKNFYRYIFLLRNDYDSVFVHMNSEYCIMGGLFWRIWHKKILLWYTHKAVNWRLRFGVVFANKIFTASKESFRLKSKKVEIVGHGIAVEIFSSAKKKVVGENDLHLLAVGRVTPSKDLVTAIKAAIILYKEKKIPIHFDIVGDPITKSDFMYKKDLEKMTEEIKLENGRSMVDFVGKCSHNRMPEIYYNHQILIHTSITGSMDKVVLEALATGRIVVTSSEAYADLEKNGLVYTFKAGDCRGLAATVEKIYTSGIIIPNEKAIEYVGKNHNLETLVNKIITYFSF